MKILLDTCSFVWAAMELEKLSDRARDVFGNPDNELFLSAISAWEIAVKHGLGKLTLSLPPQEFLQLYRREHLVQPLPLHEEDVAQLPKLPAHHKDPFDRLLVCQAATHGLAILTPDPLIKQYPVRTIW